MSKAYSFRLFNEDNPREAQAREVIEVGVGEGHLLRHVVVEALISYKNEEVKQTELTSAVMQLKEIILSLSKQPVGLPSSATLPDSFLDAVKQSICPGISAEQGFSEDNERLR